jgi:hypothetical protein
MLDALASNRKNVINIGKTPIATKLQLISNLDVMLSMDSGTHILHVKKSSRFGVHPYAAF